MSAEQKKIRPADIASMIFLAGLAAQSYGLYDLFGSGVSVLVVGAQLTALGLVGSWRAE